ncbi:PAS domain-containing protein [Hyphomonas oceanitis]|uniref:PAS domain-containing protein n=1 Tax=Hyphomonas oceanitis TaxID=81033 RepID=UPI003002061B
MQDRSLHPNTRILVDAWRRMGRTPSTNTVDDPRVAEHPELMTQLFVVQHSREYGWLFRTAGQGLSGLLGRDLTNHDFLQLWSGPDREMMAHFMEAVRFDGAPGIIRGRGETLTGQRVEVEITLMPLVRPGSGAHNDTPRLLGLYQTLGGEPMLKGRPIWRHRISMLVPPDTRSEGPQLRLVTANA